MEAGLGLRDPARFALRGSLRFGEDCVFDINVVVSGEVRLGKLGDAELAKLAARLAPEAARDTRAEQLRAVLNAKRRHARGEMAVGDELVHEGILGTTFVGKLVGEAEVGAGGDDAVRGVVPTVTGRAWITQHATVVLDPTDPFPVGYTVGDIW